MKVSVLLDFRDYIPNDDDISDELNRILGMIDDGYTSGDILIEEGEDDGELLPVLHNGWWSIDKE